MSAAELALHALVADYLDTGRAHQLHGLEHAAKKGRASKERVQLMIAFARARVAHPSCRKHFPSMVA